MSLRYLIVTRAGLITLLVITLAGCASVAPIAPGDVLLTGHYFSNHQEPLEVLFESDRWQCQRERIDGLDCETCLNISGAPADIHEPKLAPTGISGRQEVWVRTHRVRPGKKVSWCERPEQRHALGPFYVCAADVAIPPQFDPEGFIVNMRPCAVAWQR